jgi:protein-S-isoprenylcysteine O-methyltransferase Ste14
MNPMTDPVLLGIATVCFVCSLIAINLVIRVKNTFSALPRLERPWVLLALGVASVLVAALTVLFPEVYPSFEFTRLIQIVAAVSAAFFILTAMVTMKRAWTIGEGD